MNEEIEYAKMLEIPVSTINVLHKNRRLKFRTADLKEKLIAKVNDDVNPPEKEEEDKTFSPLPPSDERIDTVRVGEENESFFDEEEPVAEYDELAEYEENERQFSGYEEQTNKRVNRILNVEFALACALCGAIFLTNVFMPNSAINTFFTSLASPKAEEADNRKFSDFTLNSVLGAYSEIDLALSETGVLSFTGEGCVYPVADGEVASVTKGEDGLYTVTVAHSDTFQGVIGGLDYVYYQEGDLVKGNVPLGFSKGETEVQVTMYSQGELLNCFEMDEENCLTWIQNDE